MSIAHFRLQENKSKCRMAMLFAIRHWGVFEPQGYGIAPENALFALC